jgi:hypothetical protein
LNRQRSLLQQLHGYATSAQQLLDCWKAGDGSGVGSGKCVVDQLAGLLPVLLTVRPVDGEVSTAEGNAAAAALSPTGKADGTTANGAAAAAASPPVGAAAVAGAPAPAGKDVDAKVALQFVCSLQEHAAAMSAFNLLSKLLQGPSSNLRQLAAAVASRPADRATMKTALNPAAALNPNGALGPGGPLNSWSGGVAAFASFVPDGFCQEVLIPEVLNSGVLQVLERGLRAAVCALEASSNDLLWAVQGGDTQVGLAAALDAALPLHCAQQC